jgi:hypothetical protein
MLVAYVGIRIGTYGMDTRFESWSLRIKFLSGKNERHD